MIGRAVLASALLAIALPASGAAQPLLPDSSLTTLLQPQSLARPQPLSPQDRLGSSRQAGRAGTPCERARAPGAGPTGTTTVSPSSSGPTAYGGSGPGEFAKYLPNAPAPGGSATRPAASGRPDPSMPTSSTPGPGVPTSRTLGTDRPLVGGTQRPLWATGEASAAASKPADPTSRSPAGESDDPAAPADAAPAVLPQDRPLWAQGPLAAASGEPAIGGSGVGAGPASIPCVPSPAR